MKVIWTTYGHFVHKFEGGVGVAVLKIININVSKGGSSAHLRKALNYIMKPEKTKEGFVGGEHCIPNPQIAYDTFMDTKKYFGKTGKRQAYHFIISFAPGEASPEQVYDITKRFTEKMLQGYESVYAVHTDKDHCHGHIIFNSVNYKDGYKFRYERGDWANIYQPELNRLCDEYGLSKIEIEKEKYKGKKVVQQKYEKGRSHNNSSYCNNKDENCYHWNDFIRKDLDELVYECNTMDELIQGLRERGYKIKQGAHLALLPPGKDKNGRYRRVYKLGAEYTEEMLQERMNMKNKPLPEHFISETAILYYVFPQRMRVSWQKRKKANSVWQTEMSKYIYQQMTCPKGKRLSYQEIKQRQNEIQKVHRRMEIMNLYQIHDKESLKDARKSLETKLEKSLEQRKELNQKRKLYNKIFQAYEKIKALAGDESSVEYERALAILRKNNITLQDVEKLKEQIKEERKKINTYRRGIFSDLERLEEIEKNVVPAEKQVTIPKSREGR